MTFKDYQTLALEADRTGDDPVKGLMIPLLGLAGETGSLLSEYKKWLRDGESYVPFSDQVSEEIGDILWYLATLSSKLNLDLGEIAEENIAKIRERWPRQRDTQDQLFASSPRRYDSAYPAEEQLPTHLCMELIERDSPLGRQLVVRMNDGEVGDPLTDNSHVNDGYRYHDVFHIGCAVLLGWSPVMRRILKCKRKSVPTVDMVEDGARALVTEEGVSAVVFGYARDFSMFEKSTEVPYALLRTIRGMTSAFEVRTRSLAEWQHAILESCAVWRQLIQYSGGTVIADAATQRMSFVPRQG